MTTTTGGSAGDREELAKIIASAFGEQQTATYAEVTFHGRGGSDAGNRALLYGRIEHIIADAILAAGFGRGDTTDKPSGSHEGTGVITGSHDGSGGALLPRISQQQTGRDGGGE